MLMYSDFYDIAKYGNDNWKGHYTEKEIAINAYNYTIEYETSLQFHKMTHIIKDLVELLTEDRKVSTNDDIEYWLSELKDVEREVNNHGTA